MVSMHTSPDAQPGATDAGGMNVTILETALQLGARGVSVDLITRSSGETESRAVAPGVMLHSLRAGVAAAMPKGSLATVTDEFGEAVAQLSRSANYDVIHSHYWLSGIATLPVAIELGIPFVQSFHTLGVLKNGADIPHTAPESDRRLWSERYLATQADAVIAVSAAEASTLIDNVGAPASKLWVIPPGVDKDTFTPILKSSAVTAHAFLGVPTERPILTVVGNIQPLKGQELAIRALAAMRGPRPILAIVGEPALGADGYFSELRELVVRLGLSGDVRFLGALNRNEIAFFLANSSVTLVPSYVETYGLVALEAAASATPVVAMRVGGLSEAVIDGETGVLLDTRDPEEWAGTITALIADKPRRDRLGAAARARAEGLGWGAAATSVLGVYASLVGRP